jgi:hypothetical protein
MKGKRVGADLVFTVRNDKRVVDRDDSALLDCLDVLLLAVRFPLVFDARKHDLTIEW